MSFDELCKDFDRRCPKCSPIGRRFWFTAKWVNGNDTINDLLIHWLKEWNLPWLRSYDGTIWFIYDGKWTSCEPELLMGRKVQFYILEFAD